MKHGNFWERTAPRGSDGFELIYECKRRPSSITRRSNVVRARLGVFGVFFIFNMIFWRKMPVSRKMATLDRIAWQTGILTSSQQLESVNTNLWPHSSYLFSILFRLDVSVKNWHFHRILICFIFIINFD